MGVEALNVLADRGYFNGEEVLACEGTGRHALRPQAAHLSGTKRGFFTQDFIYDAEHDVYRCPAGAELTKAHSTRRISKDDMTSTAT